jgi:hypothetical protein
MADPENLVPPEFAALIGYELRTIPQWGRLMRGDVPLHVGDRFTQEDINNSTVRYEHTVLFQGDQTEALDGFKFVLTDNGSTIVDPTLYTSCMPVPEIPVPADGVYQFTIHIQGRPFPTGSSLPVSIGEGNARMLTEYNINITAEGSTRGQIVHQVVKPPRMGRITLNGRPASMFTQQDVVEGRVSYVHTGTDLVDSFELTSCTQFSKCQNNVIKITATQGLHITGDNVFYAKVSTKWRQPLEANRNPVLWELIGGDDKAPYLSTPASGVISWSYYDDQYTSAPAGSSLRGLGYDKLPEFRNLPYRYQWNGGLPFGSYVDNGEGAIWTANRYPYKPDEASTWKLPPDPTVFHWAMRATDPYTGDTAIRQFTLYVTNSGLGPNGQTSETI